MVERVAAVGRGSRVHWVLRVSGSGGSAATAGPRGGLSVTFARPPTGHRGGAQRQPHGHDPGDPAAGVRGAGRAAPPGRVLRRRGGHRDGDRVHAGRGGLGVHRLRAGGRAAPGGAGRGATDAGALGAAHVTPSRGACGLCRAPRGPGAARLQTGAPPRSAVFGASCQSALRAALPSSLGRARRLASPAIQDPAPSTHPAYPV